MARGGKLGWFLGLIFGTLFGVLYAPRKGKELRSQIKQDRKRGKLGIAPLQQDFKKLGEEIYGLAKEFYDWEPVKDIVERGREKMKALSNEFVSEVADFHVTRIAPLEREVRRNIRIAKKQGRKAAKEIKKKFL